MVGTGSMGRIGRDLAAQRKKSNPYRHLKEKRKSMKAKPGLCSCLLALALLGTPHLLAAQSSVPTFDLVITNGHIVDGAGSPWYSGDLGITGGKIAAIGALAAASPRRTTHTPGQ